MPECQPAWHSHSPTHPRPGAWHFLLVILKDIHSPGTDACLQILPLSQGSFGGPEEGLSPHRQAGHLHF